jgi:hypothetical protein
VLKADYLEVWVLVGVEMVDIHHGPGDAGRWDGNHFEATELKNCWRDLGRLNGGTEHPREKETIQHCLDIQISSREISLILLVAHEFCDVD